MPFKKALLLLALCLHLSGCSPKTQNGATASTAPESIQTQATSTVIKASFLIFTNGIKRDFADPKYHNLNPEVYIDTTSPTTVVVKDENLTWQDFFNTLPMKLTSECLTTGTGQNFCTTTTSSLKFFINGKLTPDALSQKIKDEDKLLVTYGNEQQHSQRIQSEQKQVPEPN